MIENEPENYLKITIHFSAIDCANVWENFLALYE